MTMTLDDADLSTMSIANIVRVSSSPTHPRRDPGDMFRTLLEVFGEDDTLDQLEIAQRCIDRGPKMTWFPPEFHALRAGEAIGWGIEFRLLERDVDGRVRLLPKGRDILSLAAKKRHLWAAAVIENIRDLHRGKAAQ